MKRRRKVIVEIATSADGYIARSDGDVAWLDRPQPKDHYGMGIFMKTIDTILWGRKTYIKGVEMGMKDGGFGPKIKNYLFSRKPQGSLLQGFELVREPIKPFMQGLRAQPIAVTNRERVARVDVGVGWLTHAWVVVPVTGLCDGVAGVGHCGMVLSPSYRCLLD